MFWQYVPLVGLLCFFAVGVVWRSWLQYRRHGRAGIILFHSPRLAQRVRDGLLVGLFALIVAQAVVGAIAPGLLTPLYVLPAASQAQLLIGAALLFGGTAFVAVAQLDLGASWRIGIDEKASPGLVHVGLYRFCRNPIFLGMLACLAGLALLQPTWLSALLLIVAALGVRSQVREEEAYLLRTYGDAYRAYARRVGRFVAGVGRLA